MSDFPKLVVQGTAFHTPERTRLEVLENGAIAVDAHGKITSVERAGSSGHAALLEGAGARGVLHRLGPDDYLIPGLVDLHIHAPQWPQLGKALDAPLEDWLLKYTFPLEAKFSDHVFAARVYDDLVGTLLAHGTTTAVYFGSVDLQANVILAEACWRRGQRALVGKVAMDDPTSCPDYYRDDSAETAIAETVEFIDTLFALQGKDPLVLPAITPRFIPSCTDELLHGLGTLAATTGCHIQTHCAESDWEVAFVRERTGMSDPEALDRFGLMTESTILAHGNFLTDSDMEMIATKGSVVAHCPTSNVYFANAVFPLRRAFTAGVQVGLGTDVSGGFSPSILESARSALLASRCACSGTDPNVARALRGSSETPLSTLEAFWLATAGGGEALSLPIGQFRTDFAFDAIVVRANESGSAFRVMADLDQTEEAFEKMVLTMHHTDIQRVWVNGCDTIESC